MVKLFNPAIQHTDPDNLQFCLKISDTEFWYCEPNIYHELIYTEGTIENLIYHTFKGNPDGLLALASSVKEVRSFIYNQYLWLEGTSDINDFDDKEKLQLLDDYGYSWEDFEDDADRNQIICENYFEQNPMDFRNDI